MKTIMAGLACGEPNPMAWEILRDYADLFAVCSDDVSRRGMRVLGNPLEGDERVISGESGAVTLGLVYEMLTRRELSPLREGSRDRPESRILLFSTEGDTDPGHLPGNCLGGRRFARGPVCAPVRHGLAAGHRTVIWFGRHK